MKHNPHIENEIRIENDAYNKVWITNEGLIGSSIVSVDELDVAGSDKADAAPFMVCWLRNIDRLCALLPKEFSYNDYALIDVGCGSGISTLYFLKSYSFKSIEGFDFSSYLIELAQNNKQITLNNNFPVKKLTFKQKDARDYRLAEMPTILFMFNPFGWDTMQIFIKNNLEVLRKTKSYLLYANDLHINELGAYGTILQRDDFYNLSVIYFGD